MELYVLGAALVASGFYITHLHSKLVRYNKERNMLAALVFSMIEEEDKDARDQ